MRPGAAANDDLDVLADLLWAERHVVEYLLFKLVTAKLILAADERRFVGLALDEVERVLAALRDAEARRAHALSAVAASWNMPAAQLTLGELVARAPANRRSVFRDHQEGFLKLAEEIEETSRTNRRLASSALQQLRTRLGALTGPDTPTTYTATGRPDTSMTVPVRLDQVL